MSKILWAVMALAAVGSAAAGSTCTDSRSICLSKAIADQRISGRWIFRCASWAASLIRASSHRPVRVMWERRLGARQNWTFSREPCGRRLAVAADDRSLWRTLGLAR